MPARLCVYVRRIKGSSMLQPKAKLQRKSVKISISLQLLEDAKVSSIDISRAAETGIAKAIAKKKTLQWQAENKKAIASSNGYVSRNGLPLAKYRPF
ncbi:post-segregation antitoxin CcdA [Mesorhizobium japonicum]|nr:type II toxin-antitoxin system CcdA family antitoxin [Mesorhizobium japonicum]PBB12918.1 post-segregation antitoxin CcdA [Mesorhizobium loti]QGX81022.1 post-segregation antitoxin CcdA [Mesorhizobium japonicum R7A]MBE1715814.1 type II toxin-antitoxin system CcdA family antitoxin [Mesorhizobium japonicum]MUT20492.1 post-segregation antitoxin CcdA [Mesorhizobium japonicum]